MSNTFIQEAFQNAYLVEDAEEFSLNVSGPDDVESFLDIIDGTEDEVISDIYDLEAEAKEELKQSYIGKVILDCNVCHSNVFFDRDQITEDEDGLCCVDIECPYCMSNEGYTIIGEVKPYGELEEVPEEEEIEEPEEEEVEDNLEEGFKADEVKELRGDEEINGADGPLKSELEGSDEIRGPKYTELGEGCEGCEDDEKEDLEEGIEDVQVTTEDETMTMTTKEDGGVVVETSPIPEVAVEDEVIDDAEMIAPLEPETEAEIEEVVDEVPMEDEEMIPEDEMIIEEPGEDEFEEFDEESFDQLGESYLKRCYENVTSFKTSNITINESKEFIIEGKIGFDSGNEKDTQFIFTSKNNENGKLKLEGYNKQINTGKKTFKLNCSVNDKALVCESLNYNYKSKNDLNESVRVYGTVKRK